MMRRSIWLIAAAIVSITLQSSASAESLKVYHWSTPDGEHHIGDSMPPDAAKYGYTVEDMGSGKTTVVPPPKSKQEIQHEAALAKQARTAREAAIKQSNEDNAFLARFPSKSEIDDSEQKDIAAIDQQIKRIEQKAGSLKNSGRDPLDIEVTKRGLINEITRLYVKKYDRQFLADQQRKQLAEILKRQAAQSTAK